MPRSGVRTGVHLSDGVVLGASYSPGDILPIGCYVAKGDVVYKNTNYPEGTTVAVQEENTSFLNDAVGSASATLVEILDPNITDVCYLRSTPAIFSMIKAADGLQRGGVYLNYGTKPIQYRGRTIAPGESFVAVNNTDKFTPPAAARRIKSALCSMTRVYRARSGSQHNFSGNISFIRTAA